MSMIHGSKKNDGGYAYPGPYAKPPRPGMTRRDWLAGLAMQGMLANIVDDPTAAAKELIAIPEVAYVIADAMIAEGEK